MFVNLKGPVMNVAKLKMLCIINIVLLFPSYYLAVSDCIEPLESENTHGEESATSSHIEDSHEPRTKPIKTNNKELLRLQVLKDVNNNVLNTELNVLKQELLLPQKLKNNI